MPEVRVHGFAAVQLPEEAPPFQYRNLGSLAYIGGDAAVIDPAVQGSRIGWLRGWLMGFAWKGAEVFMQNSYKNMWLVSRDLMKTKVRTQLSKQAH